MSTSTQVLEAFGMRNASALVQAAASAGVPLHIAAAFATKESNGQNIYGHDSGGVFNYGSGTTVNVTEDNYRDFYRQVVELRRTSNGVGPMQITYFGFHRDAKARGYRLWLPLDNFRYGFAIVRDYLAGNYGDASLNRAAQRYNSGRVDGAPAYGAGVVALAQAWKARLATVSDRDQRPPVTDPQKLLEDGIFGPRTIAAVQGDILKRYKASGADLKQLTVDGSWGLNSATALERCVNLWAKWRRWLFRDRLDGSLRPGARGSDVKVLQSHVGAPITGTWDVPTTRAIQRSHNAKTF